VGHSAQQQKSRDDGIDAAAAAFGCKNLESKELRQEGITFHK